MIDYLALALTHGLILLALLRILMRDELDREDPLAEQRDPAPSSSRSEARRARRQRQDRPDA